MKYLALLVFCSLATNATASTPNLPFEYSVENSRETAFRYVQQLSGGFSPAEIKEFYEAFQAPENVRCGPGDSEGSGTCSKGKLIRLENEKMTGVINLEFKDVHDPSRIYLLVTVISKEQKFNFDPKKIEFELPNQFGAYLGKGLDSKGLKITCNTRCILSVNPATPVMKRFSNPRNSLLSRLGLARSGQIFIATKSLDYLTPALSGARFSAGSHCFERPDSCLNVSSSYVSLALPQLTQPIDALMSDRAQLPITGQLPDDLVQAILSKAPNLEGTLFQNESVHVYRVASGEIRYTLDFTNWDF